MADMKEEDLAFLKKIGQIKDEDPKPKPTAKKEEE